MLTRLRVKGFKNLVDVDIHFGPFTCIAGVNGVGKSNLFDAITFLAALADKPLLEAASSVRDEAGRTGDMRSLFHRVGDSYSGQLCFVAEMIVPLEGVDDLGQSAQATTTFLRYSLTLAQRKDNGPRSFGGLEIIEESLSHIRKGEAHSHLLFPHSAKAWRQSAVTGRPSRSAGHRSAPFISTDTKDRIIKIHQDGGSRGKPQLLRASPLTRTALSTVNAAEAPTASLARREMSSWRMLQLEPSCLRRPDSFKAPAKLGSDGSHLASTLYRLAHAADTESSTDADSQTIREAQVYSQVANRLAGLIDGVKKMDIDVDSKRELMTLVLTDLDGTAHPARSLSDGTLRFLALVVLELDPEATGLLCLEEPENGIHPARIHAILDLLRAIAVDAEERVERDNPLRQVIVNTHSPGIVGEVEDADLLVAELIEAVDASRGRYRQLTFSALPDTWRAEKAGSNVVARGQLLSYLNPLSPQTLAGTAEQSHRSGHKSGRRVADRADLQMAFPFGEGA